MRRIRQHIITILILFAWHLSSGQAGVRPDQFTELTSPLTNENHEYYSQKNGLPRRIQPNNVRKFMLPQVNPVPVAFIPVTSGNVSNLGQFVIDPAGDLWFIDGAGNATNFSSNAGGSIDTLYDYGALMDYEGKSKLVYINKPGIRGVFVEIKSGDQDGGVIIEGDDSRIWQRVFDYTAGYNIEWWQAIPDDGVNDRIMIQRALDYVDSIGGGLVIIPPGVFNVSANAIREGLYIGDHTTFAGHGFVSEIRFTGNLSLSSTAILNRRSSGQYNDDQQRVGNRDIHIRDLKLSMTERHDFKNIGITLSGVLQGSIRNTWVDSCGGYSYLIGRTNDNELSGLPSQNIVIENIRATNFMDIGLEIWGADGVVAKDIDISGPGVNNGFGHGILVWNGAKNIHISDAIIRKDTSVYIDEDARHVCAIAVAAYAGDDLIVGARRTNGIVFENINSITDVALRINPITDIDSIHQVDSIVIRNCKFMGFDTLNESGDIRHVHNLTIEGCTFDRFKKHLQFSSPSVTSFQNTASDVTIRDCSFTWGEGIDFFGITNFNIYDNFFYNIFDQAPITVRGGRYGLIKHNYFLNIGISFDQWCITLNKLTASITRDTRHIEVTHNTACDDRASKRTDDLVTMYDATDSITIKYNVLDCADTDADQFSNLGTGTEISIEGSGGSSFGGWYEEGTTSPPDAITDNIFTEAPQVGIGLDNPETNLHIQGGGLVVARIESTAGQAQLNIKGTSLGQIDNTIGDFYITNSADSKDVIIRAEAAEKLRITPTNVKSSVGLGYTTSGGTAIKVTGETSSGNLVPISLSGLNLTGNVLSIDPGSQDSVFTMPPDTICIVFMGDTLCVSNDSIIFNLAGDTLCVIQGGDTTCVALGGFTDTNLANTNLTFDMPHTHNLQSYALAFNDGTSTRFRINPNPPSPGDYTSIIGGGGFANQSSLALTNNNNGANADVMLRFQATGSPSRHYAMGVDRSMGTFSFCENNDLGSDVWMRYFGAGDSLVFLKDIQIDGGLLDSDGDYGTPGDVLSTTGTGTDWIAAGGGGSTAISALTDAIGTNTIDNDDYAQEWQWNTLTNNSGLKLSSVSTAASSNTQTIFHVLLSGLNSNSSQTTYGGQFSNTHTGTNSYNYGLYSYAGNGTYNVGLAGTGSFIGVQGISATTGNGVYGQSTSGNGVYGQSSTGAGLYGYNTSSGYAIIGKVQTSSTAIARPLMTLDAQSTGAAAPGFGSQFTLRASIRNSGPDSLLMVKAVWSDTTYASRQARATMRVQSGGVLNDIVYLEGDKRFRFAGRAEEQQGADVASTAGALTLGSDGNTFEITGTSAITLISNVGWQNGSTITLIFTSTASLVNGTATSGNNIIMKLGGAANFNATADDVITLKLCEIGGVQAWREMSRSAN